MTEIVAAVAAEPARNFRRDKARPNDRESIFHPPFRIRIGGLVALVVTLLSILLDQKMNELQNKVNSLHRWAMAGLRERQKAGRRRDILEAASDLFRRDGYADTSVEAIAVLAEVATGTVYNYFSSKGDLLLALVVLDGEEVRAEGSRLIANAPPDPERAVFRMLASYVDHSLVHLTKELWRNAMATALTQPDSPFGLGYADNDRKLATQVGGLVAALQDKGHIDPTSDPVAAGQALFNVVNGLFTQFVTDEAMPLSILHQRLMAQIKVILNGLVPSEALSAKEHRRLA